MLMIPSAEQGHWYDYMKPLFLDSDSRNTFSMPAQYMFNVPDLKDIEDGQAYTLAQMDQHGIARAMVGISGDASLTHEKAVAEHPERFFASYEANPNLAMEEVRKIRVDVLKKTSCTSILQRWFADEPHRTSQMASGRIEGTVRQQAELAPEDGTYQATREERERCNQNWAIVC